jgi:DNA adenine methylase
MNKSFLKWAGGKSKLLDKILPHLDGYTTLIEPFCGSGVVWMNSNHKTKIVGDINSDLINLFKFIQNEGKSFIDFTESFFANSNNLEKYTEYRDKFNSTKDLREKSALFIYLNRHCYNGLWRYNLKGFFNVPFFKHKTIYFPKEEMMSAHTQSENVTFYCADFEELFKIANENCIIYCDPPFDVVPSNKRRNDGGYVAYGKNKFDKEEQVKLSNYVENSKCKVVVSNSDTQFIREIYAGFKFYELSVRRFMACKEKNKMGELLITSK